MVDKAEFALRIFWDHTEARNPQVVERGKMKWACHKPQLQLLLKLLGYDGLELNSRF